MRNDMNHVVSKGGTAGKYRPFAGRAVRSHIAFNDLHASMQTVYDDFGYVDGVERVIELKSRDGVVVKTTGNVMAAAELTGVQFEPVDIGRVPMRAQRDRGRNRSPRFSPLKRWLAAQAGRPWSDVRSELSDRHVPALDGSLKEWIADRVAEKCFRADGIIYFCTRYWGVQEASWNDYYVDPDSGLLQASSFRANRRTEVRRQRRQEEADRNQVFRKGPGNVQYHRRDGIWYEVHVASFAKVFESLPPEAFVPRVWDSFRKCERMAYHMSVSLALYGDMDLYAASHRALGRDEAKRLGLH